MGGTVHLGHPLAIKGYENRRVKNDLADATLLADLLRMPEAWIAPDSIRQLRELVRYRHKLSQMRTGLKGQIHSVMGKEGIIPTLVGLWGPAGGAYLDSLDMGDAYALRVVSLSNPARFGGTAKSTAIPSPPVDPRIATWWLATTAASILTVTRLGSKTIEGPPHLYRAADAHDTGRTSPFRFRRTLEHAHKTREWSSPDTTQSRNGRTTRPPDHVSYTMRTPGHGGTTKSLNRVCSGDEPRRRS